MNAGAPGARHGNLSVNMPEPAPLLSLIPVPVWVVRRRLRYFYTTLFGNSKLAGEPVGVTWERDWEIVRAIKRVAQAPPQRKDVDADGLELWKTPLGDFWTPPEVSSLFVRMVVTEALSDTYRFAAQKWTTPPIALDCGANIGMFTRLALRHGAARVVCFEPSPTTAACLRKTFEPEIAAGQVTVVSKGVWNRTETLRFTARNRANPGTHQIAGPEDAHDESDITIEVVAIDEVVAELDLPSLQFIKMDIEGAEVNALKGACETIRRFRPRIGMGTEHTSDVSANNEAVIRTVRDIDPSYQVVFTEVHPEQSASHGFTLAPYSLFFF